MADEEEVRFSQRLAKKAGAEFDVHERTLLKALKGCTARDGELLIAQCLDLFREERLQRDVPRAVEYYWKLAREQEAKEAERGDRK